MGGSSQLAGEELAFNGGAQCWDLGSGLGGGGRRMNLEEGGGGASGRPGVSWSFSPLGPGPGPGTDTPVPARFLLPPHCLWMLVPFQNLTHVAQALLCKPQSPFLCDYTFLGFFWGVFFFGIQSLLTGKSVLEVGEADFLLHAKAITGLSGPEPTHVCAQTVQLPSPRPGKVCPAVSLEPARRR